MDTRELPAYVPIQNLEKEEPEIIESDDEDISEPTCEDAFVLDPEKAKTPSPHTGRLRQAFDHLLPYLRRGVQGLIPTFFQSRTREPRSLHSTAWLDGLRGVAALLVVFHHASLLGFSWDIHDGWAADMHQKAWFIRLPIIRILISGPALVAIFFVVSGYAISHKALKLSHKGRYAEVGASLFSSVFRRHTRLFLPASIIVFCTAMITYLIPTWFGTIGFVGVALPTRTVPQASTFLGQLKNWFDAELQSTRPLANGFYESTDPHIKENTFDPNLWTLPMEYTSSMVVFLFLMAGAKLKNRVRMALAMFLIIYFQYNWDFPAIHLFLAGMLICDLHFELDEMHPASDASTDTFPLASRPRAKARGNIVMRTIDRVKHSNVVGRIFGFAAFMVAMWLLCTPELTYAPHETWGYKTLTGWVSPWYGDHILTPTGAILLVVVLDQAPYLQILFTNRFSQYLGKISYALYLIHGPLLWSVGLRIAHFTVGSITGGDTDGAYFAGMMLAFALWWPLAIYLSDLVVQHIDDNCVWLARWTYEKLSKEEA